MKATNDWQLSWTGTNDGNIMQWFPWILQSDKWALKHNNHTLECLSSSIYLKLKTHSTVSRYISSINSQVIKHFLTLLPEDSLIFPLFAYSQRREYSNIDFIRIPLLYTKVYVYSDYINISFCEYFCQSKMLCEFKTNHLNFSTDWKMNGDEVIFIFFMVYEYAQGHGTVDI